MACFFLSDEEPETAPVAEAMTPPALDPVFFLSDMVREAIDGLDREDGCRDEAFPCCSSYGW